MEIYVPKLIMCWAQCCMAVGLQSSGMRKQRGRGRVKGAILGSAKTWQGNRQYLVGCYHYCAHMTDNKHFLVATSVPYEKFILSLLRQFFATPDAR